MSRVRRLFTALVVALGLGTFLYLLWRFDPASVWARLKDFGPGFLAVLPFQLFDHMLNAAGWQLAFPRDAARRVSFWDLVRVRVAGDGVNYLTPSGNLAGEFVRPAMLRSDLSSEAKIASVFVAKAAQASGQALFILLGMGYLVWGSSYAFEEGQAKWGAVGVAVILFGVTFCVAAFAADPPAWVKARFPKFVEGSAPVRRSLQGYLRAHPFRLAGSTLMFMIGYAWGAAEIWLITRFLGVGLTLHQCLAIEFLSNLVDALAFMVPAKIGTQEGGKAVIFKGLGLAPDLGFTVGLIRHIRELAWAGSGLAMFAAHQKAVSPAPPRS